MNGRHVLLFSFLGYLCLWFFLTESEWLRHGYAHQINGIGAFFGVCGYLLFSISLLLSSRFSKQTEKWGLEQLFGGLDQIYAIHKTIGIAGFLFILLHPSTLALKWGFNHWARFFLPIHERYTVNIGVYAFWLMVLLLGITLLKLLPYDKWKITHKGMSIVYILATAHYILSGKLFGSEHAVKLYLGTPMLIGLSSIFYKQIYYSFIKRFPRYRVEHISQINENTFEIQMTPLSKSVSFFLGQYGFFQFYGPNISKESHPFTLCADSSKDLLSIIVKSRGDYTNALSKNLHPGCLARVEGPYGRFNYKTAGKQQIWIAGGIGVIPFILWARELAQTKDHSREINFFQCAHTEKDLLFKEEFLQLQKEVPEFHYFTFCSEKNTRISVEHIEQKAKHFSESSFLLCGPKKLTRTLSKQFRSKGIRKEVILFEDFELL